MKKGGRSPPWSNEAQRRLFHRRGTGLAAAGIQHQLLGTQLHYSEAPERPPGVRHVTFTDYLSGSA